MKKYLSSLTHVAGQDHKTEKLPKRIMFEPFIDLFPIRAFFVHALR